MKYLFCLLSLFSMHTFGQNLYLSVRGSTDLETKKIDSIGYVLKHKDAKAVVDEALKFGLKLNKLGYLEAKVSLEKKVNDSVFGYEFEMGRRTKFLHLYIGKKIYDLELYRSDSLVIGFEEAENFLKNVLTKLEANGFSMAKVKLDNIVLKKEYMVADLKIVLDKKRALNDIVVLGYDKFPEGHLKNLRRMYRNKIFNRQNLAKVHQDVDQFRFVKQLKYPEILFTKDSTKIYVYVEKAKNNTFDGFLGFTNDDKKKLIFTGYIDLVLNNILNSGEKLTLNWRSNGKEQRTFNAGVEIPYIFKSPIGMKANLNIIKQDSTFQTTKTAVDLGYYFNYNTRLYLGYQSSESSDIKNLNNALISDFNNDFVTSNFEYVNYKNDSFLFPEKTFCSVKVGTGKRTSKFQENSQFFGSLTFKHDLYLNLKNSINLKSENFYLQSNDYILNELYRFGGINSIRGFNENSLQGNFYSSILTEYRYLISSNLYVHTIFDYGYYQDKTINKTDKLLGLGFGFGLLTKNGLFNLVYANGSSQGQEIKFSNSIIHISLKASF